MSKSIVLLSDSNGNWNMTGDPVRGDGWYGHSDGLHTISIHFENFTGKLWIEASLANDPTDDDWFPIYLNYSDCYLIAEQETSVQAFSFEGNFTYIRARIDRSYLVPEPNMTIDVSTMYGSISKILLNH